MTRLRPWNIVDLTMIMYYKFFSAHQPIRNSLLAANFGVGVEARPEGPRAGGWVLGEGQPAPPHQLEGLRDNYLLLNAAQRESFSPSGSNISHWVTSFRRWVTFISPSCSVV